MTVENGTPGLRRVLIVANGRKFEMPRLTDNAVQTIDVAKAMHPGADNTIMLRGDGPADASADVLISDSAALLDWLPDGG